MNGSKSSVQTVSQFLLEAERVDFSYYDGLVLKEINLTLKAGGLVGLIGPNGSGKTTLLRVLGGFLPPKKGQVRLLGRDIGSLTRREVAKKIAVVPQDLEVPYLFSAREMVMMGRTPHVRPLLGASRQDREIAEKVMTSVGIERLAQRPFPELSGGERQKVIIAMALAQEPQILLLDEPTVHLDINHQLEVLGLIRRLNRQRGLTVLATMHDLNLAALYFDHLVLLDQGAIVAQGTPEEVLEEGRLRRVFAAPVRIQKHPAVDLPHMVIPPPLDVRT